MKRPEPPGAAPVSGLPDRRGFFRLQEGRGGSSRGLLRQVQDGFGESDPWLLGALPRRNGRGWKSRIGRRAGRYADVTRHECGFPENSRAALGAEVHLDLPPGLALAAEHLAGAGEANLIGREVGADAKRRPCPTLALLTMTCHDKARIGRDLGPERATAAVSCLAHGCLPPLACPAGLEPPGSGRIAQSDAATCAAQTRHEDFGDHPRTEE